MSTLGETALTLADWAKRKDPDGKTSDIVEVLSQSNEIIDDMLWIEGNLPTGHKTTVRTGIPAGTWRQLNYGVPQEKSATVQVTDTCGMLESYSNIDKELAELNGNTFAFRMSESKAFLEGMSQTFASTLFYGNTITAPEKFMGFQPRYLTTSSSMTASGYNVIAASTASSALNSIWIVKWGANDVHGIFPKGSRVGLVHEDLGQRTATDGNTPAGQYEVYRDHYIWKCGLCVRDWRSVARIGNINSSTLIASAATGADLVDLVIQALGRIQKPESGRTAIYCGPVIKNWFWRQVNKKAYVNFTPTKFSPEPVLNFNGYPIRQCDALIEANEIQVT